MKEILEHGEIRSPIIKRQTIESDTKEEATDHISDKKSKTKNDGKGELVGDGSPAPA